MSSVVRQGAFHTDEYRNMLFDYGYPLSEIEDRIQTCWMQLFGDSPDTRIYYEMGKDMGYMLDTGNVDVRTEGMSYGMMMAVQMDQQEIFDRIWRYTMEYMFINEGPNAGYFAWSCLPDGTRNSDGPAPDGEEFFALALFFASHRWGDKYETPFNYGQQARKLLTTCIHKGEKDGYGFPMWNLDNKLIKFVPSCEFTDPSYHLPHFYELFARWANPEDQQFWMEAAVASRHYLTTACHKETGLAPEYAYYDGTPNNEHGYGHFFSDSYRVAANLGVDAEWFGIVPELSMIAERILTFFSDKNPEDYRRYTVAGLPLEDKALHPVALIATNAVAIMASANHEHARSTVERFWKTPLRTGSRRYYDNCLYLFALLALSGRYRIWHPQ